MKVENLYKGQVFKNYKEMCEVLGLEVVTSNSKNAQFSNLKRYSNYEKQGHKIIIKEVYSNPLKRIETRGNKDGTGITLTTPLKETNPQLAKQWNAIKNGELKDSITRCIQDEYYWDCSDCSKTIYTSPFKRLNPNKGITDNAITCPYCSLSKNAKKIYDFLDKNNIKFKQEHTFEDLIGTGKTKRRLRFDFAVMSESGELIALIEYDGEYHDINESTQIHDQIKNDYCNKNNIPLLRIHHTEKKDMELKIRGFLKIHQCKETVLIDELNKRNEVILDELLTVSEKIEILKNKLASLENNYKSLSNEIEDNKLKINNLLN